MNCHKSAVSRHVSNCFPKEVAEWVKPEATKEETLNAVDELIRSYDDLLGLCESYRGVRSPDLVSVAVGVFGERGSTLSS
ncbi:MAG TPA: hypothetical protein VEF35_00500 [Candidatus Bathyarchaeia archaeon]|nr:hypothetical protein [Candidatus Bathyarchaeia archaeon]